MSPPDTAVSSARVSPGARSGAWAARLKWLGLLAASGLITAAAFPIGIPLISREELLPSGVLEPLAFVGLIPLLWAIEGLSPRKAFGGAFFAGLVFFNAASWWVNIAMTTFGGLPDLLSIPCLEILLIYCATFWGLAGAFSVYFRRRLGLPLYAQLPFAWAANELLRNYVFSGYPWANLGYSQARNLAFSQLASLAGVYGIAALIAFVNAVLYEALRAWRTKDRPLPKKALVGAAALLVAGHLFGLLRIRHMDAEAAAAPKARFAVVQGNIDQKIKNRHESMRRFILDQYNPATDAADDAGADLIVWPEAAFPGYFPPGTLTVEGTGLSRPSYKSHLLLGVGTAERATHRLTNSAFLVSPDLRVLAQYDKHHLVPFGEYVLFDLDKYLPIDKLVAGVGFYAPGKELPVLPVPLRTGGEARVAPLICFDAIFPEISVDYVRRGAQVLVNLTNDAWYGFSSAPHQFLRMVELRSIETGRATARAANTGISAFIDPVGRIVARADLGLVRSDADRVDADLHVPPAHLEAELPLMAGSTLYVLWGDSFAYLCVAATLALWAAGLFKARRERQAALPVQAVKG